MTLTSLKRQFDCRHEWDLEEEDVLRKNWPTIKFAHLPLAWIIPIEDMLLKLSDILFIKEVRQEFGQLIIVQDGLTSDNNYLIIKETEETIQALDFDLHLHFLDCKERSLQDS